MEFHGGKAFVKIKTSQIAIRILNFPATSASCERNWKVFSSVKTKKRNRLTIERTEKLVAIKYNLTLLNPSDLKPTNMKSNIVNECYSDGEKEYRTIENENTDLSNLSKDHNTSDSEDYMTDELVDDRDSEDEDEIQLENAESYELMEYDEESNKENEFVIEEVNMENKNNTVEATDEMEEPIVKNKKNLCQRFYNFKIEL